MHHRLSLIDWAASACARYCPARSRALAAYTVAMLAASLLQPVGARAQSGVSAPDLSNVDSLAGTAITVNPAIRAARQQVEAARLRVGPVGLAPDPMLMVGIRDFPIAKPGFYDNFTMKMVGVGQTIPYWGKLPLRRRVAERELEAARASLDAAMRQVARDVRDAYYELAFLDRALEIVERNQSVLVSFIRIAEARYGVGLAGQQDVLKARVEATRLAETAVSLTEQRRGTLARLNAVLDRPGDTPVKGPAVPAAVARLAVGDSAREIRFVSAALGARVADSPLPSLSALQEVAVRESPEIREHEAMIAAQAARVDLARKDHLPDFDVSFEYGQRDRYADLVSVRVALPIPLRKQQRQDLLVAETGATLASLEAQHRAKQNQIRAEVARLDAELERRRAQLALYVKAIIPQGRAALTSATASYQVGKVEFLTLLENQATLFSYETEYFRVLTEFASNLAELERIVGKEIGR